MNGFRASSQTVCSHACAQIVEDPPIFRGRTGRNPIHCTATCSVCVRNRTLFDVAVQADRVNDAGRRWSHIGGIRRDTKACSP